MAQFADRVVSYPIVGDPLMAAYSWAKSFDKLKSVFLLGEKAAGALKEKATPIAKLGAISQLDGLACYYILDRLEAVFPSIHRPTEELVGPLADRALEAAESYVEYFLPDLKSSESEPSEGGEKVQLSRYDRLMRLQTAFLHADKAKIAYHTINSTYSKMQASFNRLVSHVRLSQPTSETVNKEEFESIFSSLSSLISSYQSAAITAFPKVRDYTNNTISKSRKLLDELRQSEYVNMFTVDQLRQTFDSLHSKLVNLNERREAWVKSLTQSTIKPNECMEMKVLSEKLEGQVVLEEQLVFDEPTVAETVSTQVDPS